MLINIFRISYLAPLFPILLFIALLTPVHAMDEGGCLTCHKYPGLVALEKPNTLKILHIDEERYRASKHGTVDCRECHSEVNRIPHSGSTVVTCSMKCHHQESSMDSYELGRNCTECHMDYLDKVSHMDYYLSTFHKDEQSSVIELFNSSSCRVCHPPYPHSSNTLVRALINMHAGFMTCATCHLRNTSEGKFKVCGTCHPRTGKLIYAISSPENVVFSGTPYGRYSINRRADKSIITSIKATFNRIYSMLNPDLTEDSTSPQERVTKYRLSRIAVFSEGDRKKRLLMNTWDTKKALRFKNIEKRLHPESRKRQLKYFHRDVAKKDISLTCEECHSSESVLDYTSLGYSALKAEKLKNINIKGMVKKYDVFYLPHILDVAR